MVSKCYEVKIDNVIYAERLTLKSAILLIKGIFSEYDQDTFGVTITQKQIIGGKENEK